MNSTLKSIFQKYINRLNSYSFDCNVKTFKLLDHQLMVKDIIKNIKDINNEQRGLILYHGLGSGKTLTSIISSYVYAKSKDIIILSPASLKDNYKNEIHKMNYDEKDFNIISYNTPKVIKDIKNLDNKFIVVDEAHNLFSMISTNSKIGQYINEKFLEAKNTYFLFLTGTPIVNSPYEISLMCNILKPRLFFNKLYYSKDDFEDTYVLHEYNHKAFAEKIKGLVSYFGGIKNNKVFPRMNTKIVKLEMSQNQYNKYKYYDNLERRTFKINNKRNKLVKQSEMYKVYTRQVCNFSELDKTIIDKIPNNDLRNNLHKYSVKYSKMINTIRYSLGPVLIYSNFKETGIDIIAKILELNNMTYLKWTGDENQKEREKNLKIFNSKQNMYGDEIKCFLITSAGAEGISLKNVRQVHILEPHWNLNREQQVIGRALRLCSHNDLPQKDRYVNVYKYIACYKKIKTTDMLINELAEKKYKIIQRFLDLLKESSIDCIFSYKSCI